MSFFPTFGSFGDFISLVILVRDIASAIEDANGSAADYRSLACELDTIDAVLKQAQQLCEHHSTIPNVQILYAVAKNTIDSCQADLAFFKSQLNKYKTSLGDGSGNILKRTSRKVMWLTEKEDISKFRVKLIGYSASLNAILNMVTV